MSAKKDLVKKKYSEEKGFLCPFLQSGFFFTFKLFLHQLFQMRYFTFKFMTRPPNIYIYIIVKT